MPKTSHGLRRTFFIQKSCTMPELQKIMQYHVSQ